jgi:argininosuccinate synthase
VLHAAHQALESRVANRQEQLTGVVSLRLADGACTVEKAEV